MSKFFRGLVLYVLVNLFFTPPFIFAGTTNLTFGTSRESKISQYLDDFEKKMKSSQVREQMITRSLKDREPAETFTKLYIPSKPKPKIKREWQKKLKEWLGLHKQDRVVTGLNVGYISGNTAYDFNHHTSELEFPMDNWMLGASLKAELDKINLSVNTSLWLGIEKDAGADMKDKDWDVSGVLFTPGTLYSYTESNAELFPLIFDINGRYDFYRSKGSQSENRLGVLLGFTYEKFEYEMFDLRYITDLLFGQGGQTLYPGEKVLTYKIKYYLPYLGLAADIIRKKWGFGLSVKYSFIPRAEDKDQHLLRDLTFYADYDDGEAWMGSIYSFWKFAQQWKLKLGLDATLIRIDGETWEAGGNPAWDVDQSTDARHFVGWAGVEYIF